MLQITVAGGRGGDFLVADVGVEVAAVEEYEFLRLVRPVEGVQGVVDRQLGHT